MSRPGRGDRGAPTAVPQSGPPVQDLHLVSDIRLVMIDLGKLSKQVENLSDAMEKRVVRLEAQSEKLRDDNVALRDRIATTNEKLATLSERVAHLPGKGFIVASTLTALAVITALTVFAEKLQGLVN